MTWQKAVAMGSSIATTLAVLVGGGYFLGQYLDSRWGTLPWLTISLILAGLVMGVSNLIITLKDLGASDDKK
jgi:ATP synthase protein I